jgi:hypothetical protein
MLSEALSQLPPSRLTKRGVPLEIRLKLKKEYFIVHSFYFGNLKSRTDNEYS